MWQLYVHNLVVQGGFEMTEEKKEANQPQAEETPFSSKPEVIVLSEQDSIKFCEVLLDPPEPSAKLIEAAKRYKQRMKGRLEQ